MPKWRLCRRCWFARYTSAPDELPTVEEGIALRFFGRSPATDDEHGGLLA
jgi:hypothetical protein